MPHVIVKLWPGRTETQKHQLADDIASAVIEKLNVPESSVSVAFEEVPKEKWNEEVYIPEIQAKESSLYIKPGYKP